MPSVSIFSGIDWFIIAAFFLVTLGVGLVTSRRAGTSSTEFFLSGRDMPWWLLGVSMVATTFAIDTPNLVAGIVRQDGVAGNWVWWSLLLSGMLTVYIFAKLWRRADVMTDVEFYERRYSGKSAAFLRGFRALYLGLIFNVLVMGNVSLAAVKFGQIVLGVDPWMMLSICGIVVLIYSSLGGLRGVILTDFLQFILAMIGSVWAAIYLVNHEAVGGMTPLLTDPSVAEKLSLLPDFSNPSQWVSLLLVPLTIVWWSSYYPGAEPGGGGYVAQRLFSAKNERHSMGAALFFNIAHYALRPWPWILIALASIIVFPSVGSIKEAFPHADPRYISDDAAYPAMLTLLPSGLLGLVAASLIAAFMSTMSTQVNLGASYLVNDFYKRFIYPDASEKQLVMAGRIASASTLAAGLALGLVLTDAGQAFKLMLLLGSGTGAIYLLRWFWWRVNAVTEIVAMVSSLIIASFFTFIVPLFAPEDGGLIWSLATTLLPVILTTLCWVIAAFVTAPTAWQTLYEFYQKVQPGGPGWSVVRDMAKKDGVSLSPQNGSQTSWDVPLGLLCAALGSLTVFGAIITTGLVIYGNLLNAAAVGIPSVVFAYLQIRWWKRIETQEE